MQLLSGPNAPFFEALIQLSFGYGYASATGYTMDAVQGSFTVGLNNTRKDDAEKAIVRERGGDRGAERAAGRVPGDGEYGRRGASDAQRGGHSALVVGPDARGDAAEGGGGERLPKGLDEAR